MKPEVLPHLALAQGLISAIEGIRNLKDMEKRTLIWKFSEILRPVCEATGEAYQRGFDDGARYMLKKPPNK